MTRVRCLVDSCAYWGNNECRAEGIEVRSENEQKTPWRSDHTMCATFKEPEGG